MSVLYNQWAIKSRGNFNEFMKSRREAWFFCLVPLFSEEKSLCLQETYPKHSRNIHENRAFVFLGNML